MLYKAPEVISKGEVGKAADWWSFGIVIYEMFFGCLPFKDYE